MSKPIIQNIDQLSANETAAIDLLNRNYDKLREFIERAVFRDGSTPSEMLADLDMNSKRIINLAEPTSDNQAVRLADLKKYIVVEYNNLIEEINAAIDQAKEYRDQAESEKRTAVEASMSAAESKKDANMWALDAQDYKNQAQTYATNAAASAKQAKALVERAEAVVNELGTLADEINGEVI